MISRQAFVSFLRQIGIAPGDVLLVHSSLRRLGRIEGGADGVIDGLIEATSPGGLVAVPTHTWATVSDQQPVFHQTYTPSHVGTLTNVLRQRPGALRSLHPTHSVAAIGMRAADFVAGHERDDSPCSPTSPYGKLITWGGKVVLLGVDLTRCTFIHCLEEVAGLGEIWSLDPVARRRYLIRGDGSVVECLMRGHAGHKSDNYGRLEPELLSAGVLRKALLNDGPVYVLDAGKAAEYLVPRFRAEPKLCW